MSTAQHCADMALQIDRKRRRALLSDDHEFAREYAKQVDYWIGKMK